MARADAVSLLPNEDTKPWEKTILQAVILRDTSRRLVFIIVAKEMGGK